jgi:hypothetical protein
MQDVGENSRRITPYCLAGFCVMLFIWDEAVSEGIPEKDGAFHYGKEYCPT